MFHNCFILEQDPKADLASIRIASVNPILDPWIYILLRRSLFQRILSLTRRGRRTRGGSSPKTPRNPFHPELTGESPVLTQLIGNANITALLPSAVKSPTHNADSLCQTPTDWGRGLRRSGALSCCEQLDALALTAVVRGTERRTSLPTHNLDGTLWVTESLFTN